MKDFKPLDKPEGMNFYVIYEVKGVKYIQIQAYTYESDDHWSLSNVDKFYERLTGFIKKYKEYKGTCNDYVCDEICNCDQYEKDMSEKAILRVINKFFDKKPVHILDFKDITKDTPCGCYVNSDYKTW